MAKLPVETLLQFASVCKSWLKCQIYSSKIESRDDIKNVFLNCSKILEGCPACDKGTDSRIKALTEKFKNDVGESKVCRLLFSDNNFFLAGCVNGIICFYNLCHYELDLHVYLWNPALNQSIILAYNDLECTDYSAVCFSYNLGTEDYEVVQIAHDIKAGSYQFQIYSLKNKTWKPLSSEIIPPSGQVLLFQDYVWNNEDHIWDVIVYNGFPHWLAKIEKGPTSIPLWFDKDRKGPTSTLLVNVLDTNQEKIREIQLPDSLSNPLENSKLELFHGDLCITRGWSHSKVLPFELWVMKEHGEDVCWTKQIVTSDSPATPLHQRTSGVREMGKLLAAKKTNQYRGDYLVLYDPEKQRLIEEPAMQMESQFEPYLLVDYVPSSVSILD